MLLREQTLSIRSVVQPDSPEPLGRRPPLPPRHWRAVRSGRRLFLHSRSEPRETAAASVRHPAFGSSRGVETPRLFCSRSADTLKSLSALGARDIRNEPFLVRNFLYIHWQVSNVDRHSIYLQHPEQRIAVCPAGERPLKRKWMDVQRLLNSSGLPLCRVATNAKEQVNVGGHAVWRLRLVKNKIGGADSMDNSSRPRVFASLQQWGRSFSTQCGNRQPNKLQVLLV